MNEPQTHKLELFARAYDGTVPAVAEALRDVIRGADPSPEDPEGAFVDMACQLVLELSRRAFAIVPTDEREHPKAAERTFNVLTRWLTAHPGACYASKLDEGAKLPFLFFVHTPEITHTFRGTSAQDAHAQAAQAIEFGALS
jgi:hypothetical protein